MSREILLHTSAIKNYDNVHKWLKDKLDLPEYYGENLDALWDCLTGEILLPVTIIWVDDANSGEQYREITSLLEEASGELEEIMFGYLLEDETV